VCPYSHHHLQSRKAKKAKTESAKKDSTKKKAAKAKSGDTVEDEDEEDEKPIVQKKPISIEELADADLEAKITSVLKSVDLSTFSKKKLREELAAHYGFSVETKKDFIGQVVDKVVSTL